SELDSYLQNLAISVDIFKIKTEISTLSTNLGVQLSLEAVSDSPVYLEDLKSVKILLTQYLTSDLVSQSKLSEIITSSTIDKTKFSSGILSISFKDFDPSKIKQILLPK
ncbi:MAG: hypothetical protein KDD45_16880, partial [Bdellovibrionales bacterium]|nr:hypothetical protein [Bdellovibrionales bacterium]